MPESITTTPDMPADGVAAGVDLGGTNMQIGIVGPGGTILGRSKRKTKSEDGRDAVIERVCEGIEEAAGEARVKVSDLAGIGIGAPGAIDPDSGVVLEAVNLRWDNVPLASEMKRRLGPDVFLDNDVNVAVFGEARLGAGRGARDMIGAWVGTGVGGGLILDGKLFYGKHFTAGELGHMTLMPGNAPATRSVEHNCSRTSIVNRLTQLIQANRKSMITDLTEDRLDKIKSRVIGEAYRAGDELTRRVVDDAAERLGVTLAGIVTLLSLDRVILGGGLTEALGDPFVKIVGATIREEAFPRKVAESVEVRASELEDDAGLIGAALIALHRVGV